MTKIVQFQHSHGLVPDGIIGINTLIALKAKFNISDIQLANLMGQLHHETGGFRYDTESLNYSVSALKSTFSYYRNRPDEAALDGRTFFQKADQRGIANKVYWDGHRSDSHKLGNFAFIDGWKYRGRGAIMVTGRYNYEGFGQMLGVDLIQKPQKVATDYYWESALWYFGKRNLWSISGQITDTSITQLTKAINGGSNGLKERIKMTRKYYSILQKKKKNA